MIKKKVKLQELSYLKELLKVHKEPSNNHSSHELMLFLVIRKTIPCVDPEREEGVWTIISDVGVHSNKQLDLPWQILDPLEPWKSIKNKTRTKTKKYKIILKQTLSELFFFQLDLDIPTPLTQKFLDPRMHSTLS